jgi:ferredoxin
MRVWVDQEKCMGHARCIGLAPEVFQWNADDDRSFVPDDADVEQYEERARKAVINCPEHAIVVEP